MHDLIEVFREEVETNLREVTRLALEFEHSPPDRAGTEALMRVFHTLKGAARAVQCDQERDLAHRLEDVFHAQLDGRLPFRPEAVDLCLMAVDLIQATLGARLAGSPLPDPGEFLERISDYQAGRPLGGAAAAAPVAVPASAEAGGADGFDLVGIFAEEVAA